jgi:hypothetical protein
VEGDWPLFTVHSKMLIFLLILVRINDVDDE